MSTAYVGEIRIFAGNYGPAGWRVCDGALLPISGNEALFSLIGTTYGGDGEATFAVPDLRGRLPVGQGNGLTMGETGGVEQVTLTSQQIASHGHGWLGSAEASDGGTNPSGNVLARTPATDVYTADVVPVPLSPQMVSESGGGQPHDNIQPYTCLNFIIALFGIYPTQS